MGRAASVICCVIVLAALVTLLASPSARWGCVMMAANWLPVAPEPQPAPREDQWWQDLHDQFVEELEQADKGEGYELLFYGDSITEAWRGTNLGRPAEQFKDVPPIFETYFGSKFRSNVLGIGGDQTAHLLWRLQNGEIPKEKHPKLVVVLIGTNDLGAGADEGEPGIFRAADGAINRIVWIVRALRDRMPATHVLLLGLLPRGGPNPLYPFRQPSIYTRALDILSSRIKSLTAVDSHLHFLDCADHFLGGSHADIDPQLMPDALHPSAEGYELLAECMEGTVLSLMRPSLRDPEPWAEAGGQGGMQGEGARPAGVLRLGRPQA